MDEWRWMSAAALGREIGAGRIDPVALTETFLDAIRSHRFSDRIYARLSVERARNEASAASGRARSGLRRSPIDGVPISWKDLFDTAGLATESGSALLAGRVPERDARVLENASAAGLICLGKTHQTELAFSGLGLNPVTATPPCVHDPEAVPGGSSSGAAASVAFGLAAAAIGSDTGGSVRVPAAWNGLVGLKTVWGRLPLDGVVPLCPRFDTVGPICRTTEDAALLLAALEGGRPADLSGATAEGQRIAILVTGAMEGLSGIVEAGFEAAVGRLQASGVTVERIESAAVAAAMELAGPLFSPEAYATWRDEIEAAPDRMFPPVRERFRTGRDVLAADYVAAWARLDRLRRDYREETAGFDAVILPTVAGVPPKAAAVEADHALFTSENLLALRNTRIANLMGLAGLSLPTGTAFVGLQLQGPSEERLLRLGAAFAEALAEKPQVASGD